MGKTNIIASLIPTLRNLRTQNIKMALSMKSAVSMPVAKSTVAVRARRSVVCVADMSSAKKVAQAATVGVASLALAFGANAAGAVKPGSVTISKGDKVTWTNNAGFPHNIVFDEDDVPEGVNADKLSRADYLNAPGETYELTFDTAGEYGYYCEPHQGAGMVGRVIVQ